MKILIASATGNIGSRMVPLLANEQGNIIAAARNAQKVKNKIGLENVEYRSLDFTAPGTWESALKDVSSMFFVLPPGSASESQQTAFFEKAKSMGLAHLVYSSGRTTGPIEGSPLNVTENLLKKSGIDWTILRPGWFMQNFINWVGFTIPSENAFYLPAGDSKTAFIDVQDIAAVAAEILSRPPVHAGKTYNLTSDEAINHQQVAEHISKASQRNIRYVPLEKDDFIISMVERGWPEKAAEKAAWLYSFVRAGEEEDVSLDVERILGRKAIRFEQFANTCFS